VAPSLFRQGQRLSYGMTLDGLGRLEEAEVGQGVIILRLPGCLCRLSNDLLCLGRSSPFLQGSGLLYESPDSIAMLSGLYQQGIRYVQILGGLLMTTAAY
jgi:hypothetical protein